MPAGKSFRSRRGPLHRREQYRDRVQPEMLEPVVQNDRIIPEFLMSKEAARNRSLPRQQGRRKFRSDQNRFITAGSGVHQYPFPSDTTMIVGFITPSVSPADNNGVSAVAFTGPAAMLMTVGVFPVPPRVRLPTEMTRSAVSSALKCRVITMPTEDGRADHRSRKAAGRTPRQRRFPSSVHHVFNIISIDSHRSAC